jgi:thiamine-monophosphate kinase
MVEGVHFLPEQDPADVAWKLVSVNMSDLAAKGADPVGVLLGYMTGDNEARFLEGLEQALAHYGVPLLGGDTVAARGPQVLGLTAIGRASHVPVPSRSGARPGDGVFVTGALGGAMAGFEALQSGSGDSLAYRRPEARLQEGTALAPLVSAMMDISDGLLLDAWRMARASGVTLALDSDTIPLAVPASRRDEALRWGDDYELLFCAANGTALPVAATRIGTAMPSGPAPLLLDGVPFADPDGLGYQH